MTLAPEAVVPVVVTPFESGTLDRAGLEREVTFLKEQGCTWAAIGYGSEVNRLTTDELATVVRTVSAELHVVGNVELTGIDAARSAAGAAAEQGAELVMVRPSGWGVASAAELESALTSVADTVPVILQDAPQHTGVQLSAGELAEVVRTGAAVGVKVESAHPAKTIRALRGLIGAEPLVYGGLGGLHAVDEMHAGATGTMPGPAFVEVLRAITTLSMDGRRAEARRLHAQLLPFLVAGDVAMEAFLMQEKHALVRRRVLRSAELRMPYASEVTHSVPAHYDALAEDMRLDRLRARCLELIGAQQ